MYFWMLLKPLLLVLQCPGLHLVALVMGRGWVVSDWVTVSAEHTRDKKQAQRNGSRHCTVQCDSSAAQQPELLNLAGVLQTLLGAVVDTVEKCCC
jgi:hypothetical protein